MSEEAEQRIGQVVSLSPVEVGHRTVQVAVEHWNVIPAAGAAIHMRFVLHIEGALRVAIVEIAQVGLHGDVEVMLLSDHLVAP